MSAEKALALNDEMLKELGEMTSDEDVRDIQSLPVMKINYDPDSIYPAGSWVVGQRKKDDAIIEEGEKVKGFVILANRNRYALYNESDANKNCNSPLHKQGEKVRGSNYGHICGKGCPMRAEGVDPRCQAQKVAFGVAITESNKAIECVAYLKGSGYMPFSNYLDEVVKVKAGSKIISVPTFTFLTMLATEKKKNGAVTYWVPIFSRGPAFTIAQIREFEAKRKQVQAYIESLNASVASVTESNGNRVSDAPVSTVTAEVIEEPLPWDDAGNTASAGEPDDIEAAIAKAMKGLA